MDAEQIWRQAQDENTSPEILAKLAKSKDKEILRLVAGNPNTPVETLEKLGKEFPDAIVENPIFDLLLLENPESKFVLLSLARASTTSVKKLRELANYQDRNIIQAVARNSNTPGDFLDYLYKNNNNRYYIPLKIFLEHKNTEGSTIKDIVIQLGTSGKDYRNLILNHPHTSEDTIEILKIYNGDKNISPSILHKLSGDENTKLLELIAKCPNTSTETLRLLSSKGSLTIRKRVAKHPNTSKDNLHNLAKYASETNYSIRIIVAANENISHKTAVMLADPLGSRDHRSWNIREKIASNNTVTKNVINNLMEDEHHRVRAAIASRKDISEEHAMMLAHDSSDLVIKNIANNPNVSNTVKKLLNVLNKNRKSYYLKRLNNIDSNRKKVDCLLAYTTGKQNFRQQARSYVHYVRQVLFNVKNPLVDSIREIIYDSEPSFILGLIHNINTPSEIIEELAENANYLIRKGVVEHSKVTVEILDKLKDDRNINVREKVAQNPKISPEIIEELAHDSVPLVRRAIAENLKTPAAILNKLKSDRSLSVRRAVAENTNTSINTLKELLNDEAPKIIESAKENLNKRLRSEQPTDRFKNQD